MKSLLVIACALLAVSGIHADSIDGYLEKSKEQLITCAKENGVTEKDVRAIYDKDEATGTDKPTCLRACVMKKFGTLEDNKINVDKMKEFIKVVYPDQPDMVESLGKVAADCVDEVKDTKDECKMAYSYIQCYVEKLRMHAN